VTVPVGKTPEPVLIGGLVIGLFNAALALVVAFGVVIPAGLGDNVALVINAVAGAVATVLPIVVGYIARGKVTPVKDTPSGQGFINAQ